MIPENIQAGQFYKDQNSYVYFVAKIFEEIVEYYLLENQGVWNSRRCHISIVSFARAVEENVTKDFISLVPLLVVKKSLFQWVVVE